MTPFDEGHDPEVEALLARLAETPARDPRAAQAGRARFLSQARELAANAAANTAETNAAAPVSAAPERRRTGWYATLSERKGNMMKRSVLVGVLVVLVAVAAAAVVLVRNVGSVSAQQVLDRAAAAAQAAPATAAGAGGIEHSRYQLFENSQALQGGQAGATTIVDSYYDLASGLNRTVTTDAAGNVLSAYADDGQLSYAMQGSDSALTIYRQPSAPDGRKGGRIGDPSATALGLFDDFRANPRVSLQGKVDWNGRPAYVLAEPNYQTQQVPGGQPNQTLTGAMQMTFDAQTYALLESKLTVRAGDQDIVLYDAQTLADEVLPAGSAVAWDLSDLHGVSFADAAPTQAPAEPEEGSISLAELATHAHVYILKSVPAGDTVEVYAEAGQPDDQPFTYEIHYKNGDQDFSLQAIGATDDNFVAENFYDGSYKTAAGLVLHYSTSGSQPGDGTSAILTTPDGYSFLLISSYDRATVQTLAENVIAAK